MIVDDAKNILARRYVATDDRIYYFALGNDSTTAVAANNLSVGGIPAEDMLPDTENIDGTNKAYLVPATTIEDLGFGRTRATLSEFDLSLISFNISDIGLVSETNKYLFCRDVLSNSDIVRNIPGGKVTLIIQWEWST